MNGPKGSPSPASLWNALLLHAPRIHFFRFCQLLELSDPLRPLLGSSDTPADDPVRFRSQPQLGFPGRELDGAEPDAEDASLPPTVRTAFLGLYGVDARMPSYFIDETAQQREGAEALAAFLDIFHHRIVTQYYRIWRKYRYPVGFARDGSDAVSTYLLSLAGMSSGVSRAHVDPRKLLSMLGLLNQKTRTAEGLAGVLQHAVPDAAITVEEFYPLWVPVDRAAAMPLGEHCVLGGGFHDRGNCLRVVIAPTLRESVASLLPGQAMHEDIIALLRCYLGYEAQAIIIMRVQPELMPAPQLESATLSLGFTSMLAQHETASPNTSISIQLATWNIANAS